ncbi:hypothetical protein [Pedobacter cryoconitis]|uniref:Uncharacterized protein n=1 Tax=Pedobacter cryoconitis TaxID=188932 RepID=A0A327TCE1_9SPHI|nr:hypothetical protein [Pedobacter cryoconitis]RAJ37303.1 hypothetical protein LY11_00379 [Pedobacter cryoconitis]
MQTTNESYLNQIKTAKRNYYIFAAVTLLIPALTLAFLANRILSLDKSLIKIEATMASFNVGTAGKGRPRYYFKVAEYPATFSRAYHGLFKSSPKDRIKAIYGHMPIFTNADTTSVPVSFYITAEDRVRLNSAKEEITWYYLSSGNIANQEKNGFYWDLYLNVSQQFSFFILATVACLLTMLTAIITLYWSARFLVVSSKSIHFTIVAVLILAGYLFISL